MADPGRINRIGPAPAHVSTQVNPDTHSGLADAYRSGFWGQLKGAAEREAAAWQQATPDFNYKDHIPEGYESFAPAFAGATTQAEIDVIRAQVDDNVALRRRRDARGFGSTLGSDLVAGIFDPANVVPMLRGSTRLATFLKTGTAVGAANAAQEVARVALDPTGTKEEMKASAVMGFTFGAVVGGGLGALTHPKPRYAGFGPGFERMVNITLHSESRGRRFGADGKILTSKAGARGEMQVMPDTARDPGWGIKPSNGTPDDDARVGRELLGKMMQRYDGDHAKAWAAYNWGARRVDKAIKKYGAEWLAHAPAETKAYVRENLEMLGELDQPMVMPGTPRETIDALEGYDIPAELDLDGAGVPVVVGPLENGGLAAFVRPKSADEIVGEVASSEARSRAIEFEGGQLDDDPFAGIEQARLKDLDAIAVHHARRANADRDYAARLGIADANERAIQVSEVKDLLLAERKARLIAETQRKVNAGEFPRGHGPREPLYDAGPSDERTTLQSLVDGLTRRADDLEQSLRRRGLDPNGNDELSALRQRITRFEAELRDAGGAVTPNIQMGELFVDSARLADEGDGFVESKVDNPFDEELRTLAELDRRKREADLDSGELADELPFGIDHDGSYVNAAMDGAHFRIDAAKILDLYESKPWTQPRNGVDPLPDDAFQTPGEWLQFVMRHEREHAVNKRLPGEDDIAYENRINQRAMDEIAAERLPGAAKRGWRERLALAGTPIARLGRWVPDQAAMIHDSLMQLASDMAIQTVGGVNGRAALREGSVHQRVLRWRAMLGDVQQTMRVAYLEHLGAGSEGSRAEVGLRSLLQGARARFGEQMTYDEFKKEVVRAQVNDLEGASPAVKMAADKLNEIGAKVEKEARELGVFAKTRELRRSAQTALSRAERWDGMAEQFKRNRMDDLAADATEQARLLREKAAQLEEEAAKPVMKPGETRYYHRIYDVSKLKADREGAVQALEQAFRREGEPDPRGAAERSYDLLTLDPDGTFKAPGHAAALKQVDLPWLDKEALPYIVDDPEVAFGIYLRKMGSEIEMTRTFGDAFGLDHLDALREDLANRGVPKKNIERALQLWEDARDHIVGGFHRRDPMAWDYRTARFLKNFTNLAVLGKMIYSQVNDVARFIGVQGTGVNRLMTGEGPGGLIGGLAALFKGDISRFSPGGNAKLAGEALELVNARMAALTIDADASVYAAKDTIVERLLAKASVPFFMLNLGTPWTIMWKEMAGVVATHNILDEAKKVAAAIRSGSDPDPKLVERLGQMSISREDAMILADMPTEQGAMNMHLANVLAWEGERGHYARQKLLSAVNGEIVRSIPTPGPLDRPRIFDGTFMSMGRREDALAEVERLREAVANEKDPEIRAGLAAELNEMRRNVGRESRVHLPLASLPFQLHSFAMASGAKVLHGLLSSQERSKVSGILAMALGGMYITWLKHFDPIGGMTGSADHAEKKQFSWDKMTWGEFLARSFEYSNLGAVFTDVVKNADLATSQWTGGFYPGAGYHGEADANEVSSELGAIAPSLGLTAQLVEPFVTHQPTDKQAAAVRRALPFNNLIWWKGAVDRLQSLASDSGSGVAPGAQIPDRSLEDTGAPDLPIWQAAAPTGPGAMPAPDPAPHQPSDPNYPLHMKPAKPGRRKKKRKVVPFPV